MADTVRRRTLVWFVGSALGAAVLGLPDPDERVFSLSDTHGPSLLDLGGMTLLLAAWAPIAMLLPAMWRTASKGRRRTAALLGAVGLVGLVVTIGADLGSTWIVAVATLVAAQAVLVAAAWPQSHLPQPPR